MNIRKIVLASAFFAVAGVAAAQSPSANLTGEAKVGDVAKVENVNTGFVTLDRLLVWARNRIIFWERGAAFIGAA